MLHIEKIHPLVLVMISLRDILVVFTTLLRASFFLNDVKLNLSDKLLYITGVCLLLICWFPVWGDLIRASPFGRDFVVLSIIVLTFMGTQFGFHKLPFRLRLTLGVVITGGDTYGTAQRIDGLRSW